MENILEILFGTLIINNLALKKFVGLSQLTRPGQDEAQTRTLGLSAAFVMLVSSLASYGIHTFILLPAGLTVLNTLVNVVLMVASTAAVMAYLKGKKPEHYAALKNALPILSINSAILYLLLTNAQNELDLPTILATSIGAPLGLLFAFVLYGAVKERLAVSDTPKAFKGLPILLVYAALALMALSGLNGIF
jgi:electron transport complex protein RnfA